MKICVFCSSSHNLPDVYVDDALEVGRGIGRHGHELVFGGYDQGLMGAVAHGAHEAGAPVWGVVTDGLNMAPGRVTFPCDHVESTPDLGVRKARMVELSDAFIALPGGLGTFDELFSVLAQAKAGEIVARTALVNTAGYFDALVAMLDHATATGLNSTDWRDYTGVFTDADEAIAFLERQR